ncbi:hypothetical protein KSP40_PGU011100 [Platanthera guangdongensis]|uniref:Uncharacterized protein n=1 Tax=Platanthera guangdongensis TaxID=2320717 RepID=A0ABR2M5M7_9ASPA
MGEGLRSNVLYHREEDGQPGETTGVVSDLFWWKGAAQPACSLVKTSEGRARCLCLTNFLFKNSLYADGRFPFWGRRRATTD